MHALFNKYKQYKLILFSFSLHLTVCVAFLHFDSNCGILISMSQSHLSRLGAFLDAVTLL